jgi:hypothetical protein
MRQIVFIEFSVAWRLKQGCDSFRSIALSVEILVNHIKVGITRFAKKLRECFLELGKFERAMYICGYPLSRLFRFVVNLFLGKKAARIRIRAGYRIAGVVSFTAAVKGIAESSEVLNSF